MSVPAVQGEFLGVPRVAADGSSAGLAEGAEPRPLTEPAHTSGTTPPAGSASGPMLFVDASDAGGAAAA